jgi:hypothetical protein
MIDHRKLDAILVLTESLNKEGQYILFTRLQSALIDTEIGRQWYLDITSSMESLKSADIKVHELLVELANLKFKLEE